MRIIAFFRRDDFRRAVELLGAENFCVYPYGVVRIGGVEMQANVISDEKITQWPVDVERIEATIYGRADLAKG